MGGGSLVVCVVWWMNQDASQEQWSELLTEMVEVDSWT